MKPNERHGNQGKHRVTKRGPALSYPMFTLVTGIVGRWRAFNACNQGKHRVTKRGPALSYPMFTLVTQGPRHRWSLESCLCDSSPATTIRFTYDHGQVISLVVIVAISIFIDMSACEASSEGDVAPFSRVVSTLTPAPPFHSVFRHLHLTSPQSYLFHRIPHLQPASAVSQPPPTLQISNLAVTSSLRVQELMSDDQREAGRIPRTVECELSQDLVDSCVPGDLVTITGVVKVSNIKDGGFKNKNNKCMFLLYIEANSVCNSKGRKGKETDESATHGASMDFSLKDLYAIQEIQSQENLLKLIVHSLCPTIYGHEVVKAGLLLALFGGCQKYVDDKNRIPIRGDPHVLIVGDPGLGKSQMLQAVCNVAPRGIYVCGNTTTTSGLTVTLARDSATGDFGLEAGALVLGDQGICGIDEFDKMGNQHQALLEAMEQQSISLAKAGIVCSLPARTSIIAAANPVGGHYNKGKTVSENLKMGSALLSRFDLVFILLDTPNEDHDHLLSEHVMAMRSGSKNILCGASVTRADTQGSNISVLEVTSDRPLKDRLKVQPGEHIDAIPHQLLRKYIGYARQYVQPKLSLDAAQVLQNFYLELRKQNQGIDSTPITTRQLESLIRLTEARARLELREEVTREDAEDVIQVMKYSLLGTYSDEFGKLDFNRSQHGSGMSHRSQAKKFVSALNRIAERTYNNLFDYQQLRQIARELQIQVPDFESFVGSLNDQGYLLKKGPKVYQLQTL
ncbi:unnamed protein product [Ranitomeya imitator]|uniref:DNA helicase n=1 Tax=Ranitomeya imitator TaxID=111125 RepID=A0ABN9MC98_9NEOB|nr:unnamed protein product [Ranitomeya imitator]